MLYKQMVNSYLPSTVYLAGCVILCPTTPGDSVISRRFAAASLPPPGAGADVTDDLWAAATASRAVQSRLPRRSRCAGFPARLQLCSELATASPGTAAVSGMAAAAIEQDGKSASTRTSAVIVAAASETIHFILFIYLK